MSRAAASLAALVLTASCREEDCEEGLSVVLERADGTFAPGDYRLDVELDGAPVTVQCLVGDDGLVDGCSGGVTTGTHPHWVWSLWAVDEGFDAMFFVVEDRHYPCEPLDHMPHHVTVVVRFGDAILAADEWTPDYHRCRAGQLCRSVFSSRHTIVLD